MTTPPASGRGPGTAPAEFTATASPGTVTLTWTAPETGRETSEYQLYVNEQPTTVIQFGAGAVPSDRAEHQLTVTEPHGYRLGRETAGQTARRQLGRLLRRTPDRARSVKSDSRSGSIGTAAK